MRGLWIDTRLTFETQTGSTAVSVEICAEKRDSELPSCANGLNDFVSELVSEPELCVRTRNLVVQPHAFQRSSKGCYLETEAWY